MSISSRSFGTAPDGSAATLWTIENANGLSLSITNWGAAVVSVLQPDRNGSVDEIVLGFPDASGYLSRLGYLGATCGRFANRIAKGRFSLEGRQYELDCNNGENHLHGGDTGFDSKLWNGNPYSEGDRTGVIFRLESPDGDQGYPGNLKVSADYALDDRNRLTMEFIADTDATTIINITNHAYWNLAGRDSGDILGHELTLYCSAYLPVDDGSIPTGEKRDVTGGPFDFRMPRTIGKGISKTGTGYDHCMLVDGEAGRLRPAARAKDPVSGRVLELHTDRPGLQLYSGNFLTGEPFQAKSGFCLEPQDLPDAPNRPSFPSVVLKAGDTYRHRSLLRFYSD